MESSFTIIEDTREQEPLNLSIFGFNVVRRKLDFGDYSIEGFEDKFSIERKRSTAELSKNIVEKRFVKELLGLNDFSCAHLLCEFPYDFIWDFPKNSGIPYSKWKYLRISGKFINKKVEHFKEHFSNIEWHFSENRMYAEYKAAELINDFIQKQNNQQTASNQS